MAPTIKSIDQIEIMRDAGRIAALALRRMGEMVQPGVSTLDLDRAAEEVILDHGATCEFNGYGPYGGFPGNVCASVNDEVVHGIPAAGRFLEDGDVVGLDVGARYQGFVGDTAKTFAVGEVSVSARALIETTEECLDRAIAMIRPGVRLHEIAAVVQRVAQERGYGIVREYAGHGIGRRMHEDPQIPNYVDHASRHSDLVLEPGMVICVEPMLNVGGDAVRVLDDNWTVVTRDGSLSAHFEHMIAVSENGAEILTLAE